MGVCLCVFGCVSMWCISMCMGKCLCVWVDDVYVYGVCLCMGVCLCVWVECLESIDVSMCMDDGQYLLCMGSVYIV
jgi:hypothetical protein